ERFVGGRLSHELPAKRHCSGVRTLVPGNHVEQRCLARAVWADQPVDGAILKRHAAAAQGLDSAVRLADLVDFEQRGHARPPVAGTASRPDGGFAVAASSLRRSRSSYHLRQRMLMLGTMPS